MGSIPAPHSGSSGFGNRNAFMGVGSPQKFKIQPVQPIAPLHAPQPIQPIRPMPPGGGFVSGNQRTMNVPGAPTLPQNPYADSAWRRQMYGPK